MDNMQPTMIPDHSALSILVDGDLCINMQMGAGETNWKRSRAYVSLFNSADKKVLHLWDSFVTDNPVFIYTLMQEKGVAWFNSLWQRYAAWKEAGNKTGAIKFLKEEASKMKEVLYSGEGVEPFTWSFDKLSPICPICGQRLTARDLTTMSDVNRMFGYDENRLRPVGGLPSPIDNMMYSWWYCPRHVNTDAIIYGYDEMKKHAKWAEFVSDPHTWGWKRKDS